MSELQYHSVNIPFDGNSTGSADISHFEKRRGDIYLKVSGEYLITINKFNLPSNKLPLFIFPIEQNQADPNKSELTVTLTYNNAGVTEYFKKELEYFSLNNDVAPTTAIPKQIINNEYYYVFSYAHMLDIVNNALEAAHTDLITAHGGAPSEAPYFLYDAEAGLFKLVTQYAYLTPIATPGGVGIFMNHKLEKYFTGFPFFYNTPNDANGIDRQIIPDGRSPYAPPGTVLPTLPILPDYVLTTQEFSSFGYWNSLQNIVFTTTRIPVIAETIQNQNEHEMNEDSILTEFTPYMPNAGDGRGIQVFQVEGERNWINLSGTGPLDQINFRVDWRDDKNVLRPLKIGYGGAVRVQFLFKFNN